MAMVHSGYPQDIAMLISEYETLEQMPERSDGEVKLAAGGFSFARNV
jgi:hypothetical protein